MQYSKTGDGGLGTIGLPVTSPGPEGQNLETERLCGGLPVAEPWVAGQSQPVGVLRWELGKEHLKCSLFWVPPPAGASHCPNPRGSQSSSKLANSVSTAQPLGARSGGRGVES